MRLIVPMGGRGTRLRPFSHTTPKPLLPLLGRPAIVHILDAFAGALGRPVDEAVFVLGPDAASGVRDALAAACDAHGLRAAFAVQPEPLGTAHAIACAGDAMDGEILTCWADTLFTPDRGAAPLASGDVDLVAWTVHVDDPRRFGVVARDENGRIVRLIEKPTTAEWTETLIGAYYVREGAALRTAVDDMLASGATGAGGEFQLTDAYDRLVQNGARMATAPAARWLDTGTLASYRQTVRALLDAGEHETAASGARGESVIVAPSYVHPDADVRRSVIGPYAVVEAGAVIRDAVVRDSVVMREAIVRHSALSGALLGDRASASGANGALVLGDDSEVHADG
ncbi:sugar phosphate nucleotidyltransferase [Rubricoccus marinus]|uniref:Nucleotidyl transferase domain-containing protein n=1 Tax=Rubricoccus marinus TaxID=716817 RepID=A0A259TU87_9BACT|nr:sugar phosphate nucleotidyltransferase [Rubricoccus marinus]OZC01319.1 hypothetical protein BSZ36_17900 [Rubricoccus marinus]